jgi:hypothetical protein
MVELKSEATLILTFVLIMAFVAPVLTVDYDPGVIIGQYVKYGNITYIVNGSESEVSVDWTRVDVTFVSGKNVTLLTSGQFKNGGAIPSNGSTSVYNIETGMLNGTTEYTYGAVIAGNLSEGDPIPPLPYGFVVNKTETRTYFGVNRTVNILETTYSDSDYGNHWLLVYDRITGLLLESGFEVTEKATQTTTSTSYSVIETNISGSVIPELSSLPFFAAGALLTLSALLRQKNQRRTRKPYHLRS